MAEPTSTGVASAVALGVALFGVTMGPYAVILFAAMAGALWPLSRAESPSKRHATFFLFRTVLASVVLTGFVLWALERWAGVTSPDLVAPVAFGISLYADKVPGWGERVIEWFISWRTSNASTPK